MNTLILKEDNIADFKKIITTLSKLINEAKVHMTKEGLELIALDGANVCMAILKINKDFFGEGSILDTEDKFCLTLPQFKRVLDRYNPKQGYKDIVLTFKDKVIVESKGKELSLPMKEINSKDNQKIPNLEDGLIIKLNSDFIQEMLLDVNVFNPNEAGIIFCLEDNKLICSSDSGVGHKTRIECAEMEIEKEAEAKASYSSSYLDKMLMPNSDLKINFKTDYPLSFSYSGDNWELDYVLAPRISND